MQIQAFVKASLLSCGIMPSQRFLDHYTPPFIEKRRAYGNADPIEFRKARLPQEIYLLPSRTIVAANIRRHSAWTLDYDEGFILVGGENIRINITFPLRPDFYDYDMSNWLPLSRIITLYGGSSLGLFIYGHCALADVNKACQYCSIKPNHQHGTEFSKLLRPSVVEESVELALADTKCPISQVMINGGNFRDMDKNFLFYAEVVKAARRAIDRSGRDVDLHLIVFPPKDLDLFCEIKDEDVSVAINTEVFDPELFARYCPGKHAVVGQTHIQRALWRAAEILEVGHVYSILVGGLEPIGKMERGMRRMADAGITPVINVFHPDPETPLADSAAPSTEAIIEMGRTLQAIYAEHDFIRPFYLDCGRNALDTEAYRQQF